MVVGLVIVSHSARLAEGVAELAGQMAHGKVAIAVAGGTAEDGLGTSVEKILGALRQVDGPNGILVLLDLGSAVITTEMALEMLSDDQRKRIRLSYAPLVEGALSAALEASLGHTLAQVQLAAEKTAHVEHLQLLKPLTQEENTTEERLVPSGTLPPGETSTREAQFTLTNPDGLHARPATLFVQTAALFQAHVRASGHGKEADATSIFELLSLSLRQGEIVTIRASGVDAQAALDALSELIHANFYETAPEGAKPVPTPSGVVSPPAYLPRRAGEPWQGTTTSAGVAVGPAFLYTSSAISLGAVERHPISAEQVGVEQQRLHEALHSAAQELHSLAIKLQSSIGQANAAIFDAQALMLLDPALREDTLHVIEAEQIDAAGALAKTGEHFAATLETLDDPLIAARGVDVRDAVSRAIGPLMTQVASRPVLSDLSQPVILLAKDLTPSDTAQLRPEFVLGICTIQGGPTAHAAILARALGIPAMVGLDETILQMIHSGDEVGLDANNGLLYQRPAPGVRAELMKHVVERQQQLVRDLRHTREDAQWRSQGGSTADGTRVQVFANVGDADGARSAAELGGEGIGLLRTEFLFGGRAVLPNEQEQFESYVKLFRAFGERARLGKTIIARTLDAGADKPFPALEPLIGSMQEANPALGLRGARIHLVHEELLRQQLRALLRAGAVSGAELAIMFPMIATIEEVHRLRTLYNAVYHELEQEGIAVSEQTQVGIMVETPAAALMADMLARYVDFFSIGANDLFQYTMAADRTNSRVTGMFGTLEPAIWRSIDMIVRAGAAHGKLVAVCGELAADTRIGPLLAGLGVRELSMSPPAMLKVKAALHAHTMDYWQHQAQELLKAETAADMQAVLQAIE